MSWISAPAAARLLLPVCFAIGAAGCGKRADLAPIPAARSGEAYCHTDDQGRLVVVIANQGGRTCIATTTTIEFTAAPQVRLPTRPIAIGQTATVRFRIPERCLKTKCRFTITADAKGEVAESDETNNQVTGTCSSPPDTGSNSPPSPQRKP